MKGLEFNRPHAVKLIGTALIGGDFTGDARGVDAIDLQTSRSTDAKVASGLGAITIGRNNIVSGDYSVSIGEDNTVSGA